MPCGSYDGGRPESLNRRELKSWHPAPRIMPIAYFIRTLKITSNEGASYSRHQPNPWKSYDVTPSRLQKTHGIWQLHLLYYQPVCRLHRKYPLQARPLLSLSLKMVESLRITEPRLLTDITAKLATLNLSAPEPPPTTLVLLQPLANAATLAACLPNSRSTSTPNLQYLDIQPLSLAWRQAVIKAPPMRDLVFDLRLPLLTGTSASSASTTSGDEIRGVPRVPRVQRVQEVQALPLPSSTPTSSPETTSASGVQGGFQKLYWVTAVPREGGLAVPTRDVMKLIVTIATGIRMRVGGDVRFGLVFDGREGVTGRAMKLLKKQLGALEKEYKKGGQGTVEEGEGESGEHYCMELRIESLEALCALEGERG
jgi:hypothetical protein